MPLSPSEALSPLEVTDLRSCDRWLERAPLADPQQAIDELCALVAAVGDRRLAPRVHFDILERVRDPAQATCEERTKRFAGKPLPLREAESQALAQVVALLRQLWTGYYTLLSDGVQHGFGVFDRKQHVLAARCLETGAEIALAYYRARQEVPAYVWKELNEVFALAENREFASEPLPAEGNRTGPTCKALFVRALLLQTARPYGLTGRELELARRWIRGWGEHVELNVVPTNYEGPVVDLRSDAPPTHRAVTAQTVQPAWRAIENLLLKRSVQKRLSALRKGTATPAELGLGRDCPAREAEVLLTHLYNAWFFPPHVRQFNRRAVREDIELLVGLESIHSMLQAQVSQTKQSEPCHAAQKWKLLEDSPAGFRVRRPEQGDRLNHLQLVAIRPPGSMQYILTETRWLMLDQRNLMSAGLQALPGLARAVYARVASLEDASDEPHHRVFVLGGSKGTDQLIVVPGAFLEGCFIELLDGERRQRVRIAAITRRGTDYDCVSIEALL